MENTWTDIPDFEGIYQINKLGQVKSLKRDVLCTDGAVKHYESRIKTMQLGNDGYYVYDLYNKDKIRKRIKVHKLLMTTFVGKSDLCIDHVDGNRLNNDLSNLEYVTSAENTRRYIRMNGHKFASEYIGVTLQDDGKWKSAITINHETFNLGRHDTEEEASQAYENALQGIFPPERVYASEVVGVTYQKREGKWRARISRPTKYGKEYIVGFFKTEQEASDALAFYKNDPTTHNPNNLYDVIRKLEKEGIVKTWACWLEYEGKRFRGYGKFQEYLEANPEIITAVAG